MKKDIDVGYIRDARFEAVRTDYERLKTMEAVIAENARALVRATQAADDARYATISNELKNIVELEAEALKQFNGRD